MLRQMCHASPGVRRALNLGSRWQKNHDMEPLERVTYSGSVLEGRLIAVLVVMK